jgi:APA family basic amino acid/polyamine antiporter
MWLLALGIVLWVITWFSNRALRARRTYLREPSDLSG